MKYTAIFVLIFFILSCESPNEPKNNRPVINSITISPLIVGIGENATLSGNASDADGDQLTYSWSSNKGSFPESNLGQSVIWTAPNSDGNNTIFLDVSDGKDVTRDSKTAYVTEFTAVVEGYVYDWEKKTKFKLINSNEPAKQSVKDNGLVGVSVYIGQTETTTSHTGHFHLNDIPVGEQTIHAEKEGYANFSDSIMVQEGTNDYDIYLPMSSGVNGYVYYSGTTIPISGVLVEIVGITSYTTTSNGYYELTSIPQGSYTITATKDEYDFFSQPINIPSENLEFNIEITAQNPAKLYGFVKNAQDDPISGATIAIKNLDGSYIDVRR
ncbi:MAG: carboxypeptidase-like regulatory domain-containing protein [Candidatus Cloacimonetes bacterium]|nr:carboxypeptidase-like regulatory domain-containing protein [Candidatus Cloacimonadota bacterium]